MRDARTAAGFHTQAALAAEIGCSRITISRAENGWGGGGILQKIARATGLPPRSLMKISGDSAQMPVTAQERELLDAFRRLDPLLQASAAGFVSGLAAGGGTEEGGALGATLRGKLAAAEVHQAAKNQRQANTGENSA